MGARGSSNRPKFSRRNFLLALTGSALFLTAPVYFFFRRRSVGGVSDLGYELFPDASGRPVATAGDCPIPIYARSVWTHERPDLTRMQPISGVHCITIHHSGFTHPFETEDLQATIAELQAIRDFHTGTQPTDRNWADIAYHFVIDRAGRAWQARPLVYQGAHVKNHNEHNLGIVLLGNFDLQTPSAAQLAALEKFVSFLRAVYNVSASDVHTHGELATTSCPGKSLQADLNAWRSSWV